ncbi:MAG: hypothetical protein PHI34_00375 [Acidobacteriota bacterium]|nr:hypothetical protein [Acidobacteriota bacterium]
MKKNEEKKGLFARLIGRSKTKSSPCCGGAVNEATPEENKDGKEEGKAPKDKKPCCCG